MSFKSDIKKSKEELRKFKDLSQDLRDWIKQKLEEHYLKDLKNDPEDFKEYFILDELVSILTQIKEAKPRDIKAFVETDLKRRGYENSLSIILSKVNKTRPNEKERLEGLLKELDLLREKIEKEVDKEYVSRMLKQCIRTNIMITMKLQGKDVEDVYVR